MSFINHVIHLEAISDYILMWHLVDIITIVLLTPADGGMMMIKNEYVSI